MKKKFQVPGETESIGYFIGRRIREKSVGFVQSSKKNLDKYARHKITKLAKEKERENQIQYRQSQNPLFSYEKRAHIAKQNSPFAVQTYGGLYSNFSSSKRRGR